MPQFDRVGINPENSRSLSIVHRRDPQFQVSDGDSGYFHIGLRNGGLTNTPASIIVLLCAIMGIVACSGVKLRSDVFLSKPVWESGTSDRLDPSGKVRAPEYPTRETALASTPALAALLKQVGLANEAKSAKVAAPGTVVVLGAGSSITLDVGSALPLMLAQNNAVKAMLLSAQESVMHARLQGYSNQLPDPKISLGDFKALITAVNSTALLPYRETGASVRVGNNPTWRWLSQKYFGTYFNGT